MAFNQTQTTNASGQATFTDVQVGTGYTLQQSVSTLVAGYDQYINSTFNVTSGMPEYEILLTPSAGNDLTLAVSVIDNASTPAPVAGSVFEVFADAAKTMSLGQFTSDVNGEFSVPHLVGMGSTVGSGRNYYIEQISAPIGYIAMAADVTVNVLLGQTPTISPIVNDLDLTAVSVRLQDANYDNIVFPNIDVNLSKA